VGTGDVLGGRGKERQKGPGTVDRGEMSFCPREERGIGRFGKGDECHWSVRQRRDLGAFSSRRVTRRLAREEKRKIGRLVGKVAESREKKELDLEFFKENALPSAREGDKGSIGGFHARRITLHEGGASMGDLTCK